MQRIKVICISLIVCCYFSTCYGHGRTVKWNPPPIPDDVIAHDYPYTLEGMSFTGYAAYPKSSLAKNSTASAPGIFIGHTWNGLSVMEKWRCQQLAAKGYICFAPDLYGTGIRPKTDAAAKAEMDKLLSNLTSFYYRMEYGMEILKTRTVQNNENAVNTSALFANGYCLGGQMVLELARRGYPNLIGVSSFHGELGNLTSQSHDHFTKEVAISVHHADLDYQGYQALLNIENEFRAHNVSTWTTTKYGNCHHAWTVPSNENYKPFEAAQSHDYMNSFYCAILKDSKSQPKGCM
jgi:dienelactone hydrolase